MDDFAANRRQRFLAEDYFHWLKDFLEESVVFWGRTLPANGTEAERRKGAAWSRATDAFRLLLLRYTGGEDMQPMRSDIERVVSFYEEYTALRRIADKDSTSPPFMFGEIGDYEAAMQLISLCHLFHRRDLLPRISGMLDPSYCAQDTLYEDLLAYGIDGRFDVDKWFQDKPYRTLINSFYRESDDESITDISAYLDEWYPALKDAPGYRDGHLNQSRSGGSYVGYWAIEAAAAAYLLELDDTPFRGNVVYPGGLVDFARAFGAREQSAPATERDGSSAIRTGQLCPETGVWKAVGHNVPGVMVRQGEVMPDVYVPDARGALRPASATWVLERKA
jgi:hypothetical protein